MKSNQSNNPSTKAIGGFAIAGVLVLAVIVSLCCIHTVKVDAGEEAVFIYKPWIWGHGGVDPKPAKTGLTWCWRSTSAETFRVVPVQYNEDFEDIISLDNTPISLTAHALIQIKSGETPKLLESFGVSWYENDIQKDFCNEVRNEIAKYPMMDLTSKRSIYDNISKHIESVLNQKIQKQHIPIRLLKVIIDKAKPNKNVLEEYNHTAAAIQAKQTQEASARMQEARKTAETKRAEADDAYRVRMGLTPEQYIHLRSLEIEKEKVDMVRDKQNVNVTMLMGNGAVPMYNVK